MLRTNTFFVKLTFLVNLSLAKNEIEYKGNLFTIINNDEVKEDNYNIDPLILRKINILTQKSRP
jgi:hypothetical protein